MIRHGLSRLAVIGLLSLTALSFYACGSDSLGPAPRGFVAITPQFSADGAAGAAQVARMRVVFTRVDGVVALDTIVDVTLASLAGVLTLEAPMAHGNATVGEDFTLLFELMTAGGQSVFRGGPLSVHAEPNQPSTAIAVTLAYVGSGSSAVRVAVSPTSGTALPGATADFTANTFDVNDAPVTGALVIWSSLDPAVATVADPTIGRFVAGSVRGSTQVRATLFNGLTSQATLTVQPPASAIAIASGNAQSGPVGTALTQPLMARVTASDALGVSGQQVSFTIVSGGGSLSAAQATTDASGLASVTYTAGSTPGNASIQATATGLTGSPISFTATIVHGTAAAMAFTSQPTNAVAGAVLPAIVAEVRDVLGNRATSFTGQVSLALETPPVGVTLQGTSSVNANAGVATFSNIRVIGGAQGLRLRATAVGVTGSAISNSFDIQVAVATQLALTATPATTSFMHQLLRIVAEARTTTGVVATQYSGTLIATIVNAPAGATFVGPDRVAFVDGVATLETSFTVPGQYDILLIAPGLTAVSAPLFTIATVVLEKVGGDDQSGNASSPLASPLTARVVSAQTGQPVADVKVDWSVNAGGGSIVAVGPRSDSNGLSSATWTLGAAGAQTAVAEVGATVQASFTATIAMVVDVLVRLASVR